jgi:hypothetical protein
MFGYDCLHGYSRAISHHHNLSNGKITYDHTLVFRSVLGNNFVAHVGSLGNN